MDPITTNITLKTANGITETKATKVRFSPYRCLLFDGKESDLRCLDRMAGHLLGRGRPVAFYGTGHLFHYFLDLCPALLREVTCVLTDDDAEAGEFIRGIPVVPAGKLRPKACTVFLCATRTEELLRMKARLPEEAKVVSLEALADLDWRSVPRWAWVPEVDSIYPMEIPDIEFLSGQDMILLDVPARNLAFMPNGLAYVHNALKKTGIKFQTVDLDIILYHSYHMHRLLDAPETMLTPSGRPMHPDPWQAEAYDEWQEADTIEFFRPQIRKIVQRLIRAQPAILGISLQACNILFAREVVKGVKAQLPQTIILVGGYSCYQSGIGRRAFPEADYMCIGEADLTVGPLVEALARGERPRDLPGVLSRYDSPGYSFSEYPFPKNLDELEMPRYEWTDMRLYRNYNHYRLTPIIASRGCRWARCTFCAERFFWRSRSPKNVADEFEYLRDQGCDLFMFNESDLNGKPEILLAICDEIVRRKLKIKLTGQLRIHKASSRHFFDRLKAAGFVALRFGVDAWSVNGLRQQMKGYTVPMIYQNLKDCWEAGIYTEVNTVVGVPGETEQDIDEGIELILKCKAFIGRMANINPLMLVTGSVYWDHPDRFKICFRRDPRELFEKYPNIIPPEFWYSEDPYIDQSIRIARFEKMARALYENGFDVGAFASKVIRDVQEGRGADKSCRPDAAKEIREEAAGLPRGGEDPSGYSVSEQPVQTIAPSPEKRPDEDWKVICYADAYYRIPLSGAGSPDNLNADVLLRRRRFRDLIGEVLREKMLPILRDRARRDRLVRRAVIVLRTEGLRVFLAKLWRKIRPDAFRTMVLDSEQAGKSNETEPRA